MSNIFCPPPTPSCQNDVITCPKSLLLLLVIYREDGVPLIDSHLLGAIFRRHFPPRQTEIAFWAKTALTGVYLSMVAMVTEAFGAKTASLDAGEVVTVTVACLAPIMMTQWRIGGGGGKGGGDAER